jgi:hypothetical protein
MIANVFLSEFKSRITDIHNENFAKNGKRGRIQRDNRTFNGVLISGARKRTMTTCQ